MKTILIIAAAAFMATAAGAQMAGPADPATPAAESMQAAPPMDAAAPLDAAPPTAAAGILERRDGKWWNGDRKATKAEIAEYKKLKKAGTPG